MPVAPPSPQVVFNDILESIEKNQLPLPTQPKMITAIQEIIDDPDLSIEGLNQVLVTDPALTARIIRIANSPLVRGRVDITSLKTAISRLGISFVANMSIGLATQQLFNSKNKIVLEKMKEAWEHCSDVAAISYVLANYTKTFAGDEALLAGLLHEIGTLPILSYADKNPSLLEATEGLSSLLQETSGRLGEAILSSWQFASYLAQVPRLIWQPTEQREETHMVDVILIAKLHTLRNSKHPLNLINKSEIPAYRKLGLDPSQDLSTHPDLGRKLEGLQGIFK